MRLVATFWSNLKNSFYNPLFYTEVAGWRRRRVVGFVFLLSILLEIVFVARMAFDAVPIVRNFDARTVIGQYYPEGLIVTIRDGVASTNVSEPYTIATPPQTEGAVVTTNQEPLPPNILVIDTTRDISVSEIATFNSLAVLTKDTLIVNKSRGETQIIPLKDIKNLTVSEENVVLWSEMFLGYVKVLAIPAILLGVLLVAPLMLLARMFFAIFSSVITMGIGKLRGRALTYWQAYNVSLVALGPLFVVDAVAVIVGISPVPFLATAIVFLGVVWLNMKPPALISPEVTGSAPQDISANDSVTPRTDG